jgi:hypothetical protein
LSFIRAQSGSDVLITNEIVEESKLSIIDLKICSSVSILIDKEK